MKVNCNHILQQCNSHTTPDAKRILLFIEKQAIVQVLCQQLIPFFDPNDPEKTHDVSCKCCVGETYFSDWRVDTLPDMVLQSWFHSL